MPDVDIKNIYFAFYWIVLIIGVCLVYTGFIPLRLLVFLLVILILVGVLVAKFAAEIEWVLFEKRRFKKDFSIC